MFHEKNILVTGGSRGIGRAVVESFAEQGGNVHFTYLSNGELAAELCDALRAKYPEQRFTPIKCDISRHEEVQKLVDTYLDDLDAIDVLVNNAGISDDALIVMMSPEQWHKVIQTNLNGVFYLTQKVAYKMLKRKKGNIVTISSFTGVCGNAGQANYAAAKAGLIGMSKTISKELANRNIRVNVVAPGFIETDMTAGLTEYMRNFYIERIGLNRMGQAHDVANAVTFLASEKAGYITGQTLVVDGGLVI